MIRPKLTIIVQFDWDGARSFDDALLMTRIYDRPDLTDDKMEQIVIRHYRRSLPLFDQKWREKKQSEQGTLDL